MPRHLLLASSRFHAVCSSAHMKMTVVMKVLPIKTLRQDELYDELSQILWTGSTRDTMRAIGTLKSRVLACRWMRWDFVKFCIEKSSLGIYYENSRSRILFGQKGCALWIKSALVIEIPRPTIKIPWVGEALIQESVVSKFVHECLDIEARKGIPNDPHES